MIVNIIDVSGFVYRSFYAVPHLIFENKDIGALYGFCNAMKRLTEQYPKTMFIAAFDSGKQTFRNEIYKDYKANRKSMPEELASQIPLIKEACERFGFVISKSEGNEADDIIASYVSILKNKPNITVNIISSDKDLTQLIQFENINMFDPMKRKYITKDDVIKKFGVSPEKIADLLSLMGDSSDNIPGVKGIGPKTAASLINKFGSLDGIIKNIHTLPKGKKFEALKNEIDKAILSKKLVLFNNNISIDFEYKETKTNGINKFFEQYNFKSLL